MKLTQFLSVLAVTFALVGSVLAADGKVTPGSCCDKAAKKGEKCAHPCCVEAAKENKVCAKCNK